ncbi:MAG TPA: hypothetical protein VFE33_15830 [Thermoanaerobaculia bacterium]|nr:hypothetical protein [Thermoanaerobaculia bacterium]
MAIKGNASGQRTGRWEVLLNNLRPSLSDMPHIADDFKALEALLPQARALQTQREDLRSQASVLSKNVAQALKEGDKIRARMGSTLKGKFGFTDATLSKYGFRPVTGRRRKSPDSTPPPTVEAQAKPVAAAPGTSPAAPAKGAK